MDTSSIAAILLRWTHISSAILLVGGAAVAAVLGKQSRLKGPAWTVAQAFPIVVAMLLSGIYQLLARMPGATPVYHAVFGAKFLLAMHVAAMVLIAAKPEVDDAKRARLLTGAAISGFVIVLLGAVLRSL